MSMCKSKNSFILHDVLIIIASVFLAVILVTSGVLSHALASAKEVWLLGSFIAGMFFTSVFTTAPAIAALGEIATAHSLFITALIGAAGSVLGDLIIFRFIRDRFSGHLLEVMQHRSAGKRFKVLMRLKYFRWFTFLLGGVILASPFPDELGIGLMGFAKMKMRAFIPVSFVFNFLGIILIGLVARSV